MKLIGWINSISKRIWYGYMSKKSNCKKDSNTKTNVQVATAFLLYQSKEWNYIKIILMLDL
jgi:hypothetical protein